MKVNVCGSYAFSFCVMIVKTKLS